MSRQKKYANCAHRRGWRSLAAAAGCSPSFQPANALTLHARVDQPAPRPAQLLALSRVLEEALTNVLKHAGASRLDIEVRAEAQNGLGLEVRDNGRGFDVDKVLAPGTGAGMSSMRLRIERMGGQLRIQSRPGETRLIAVIHDAPLLAGGKKNQAGQNLGRPHHQ